MTYGYTWHNKVVAQWGSLSGDYSGSPSSSRMNGASETTGWAIGAAYDGTTNVATRWVGSTPTALADPSAGRPSVVRAISDDGSVAVGTYNNGSVDVIVRWTSSGTVVAALPFPAGATAVEIPNEQTGRIISGDGSKIIAATATKLAGPGAYLLPAVWTNGVVSLIMPTYIGSYIAQANGISRDGSTYLCQRYDGLGFLSDGTTARYLLPFGFPPDYNATNPLFCLADGSVVWGKAWALNPDQWCYWDSLSTITPGGVLPGGASFHGAINFLIVPPDGGGVLACAEELIAGQPVCVGYAIDGGNQYAAKWTGTILELLDLLPGGVWARANGISADGSIIVGDAEDVDGNRHAVYWDNTGIHEFEAPAGFAFTSSYANGVSYDGAYVWGSGDIDVSAPPGIPTNLGCA